MIAAIDADSIIYIIAWAHKDNKKEEPGMIGIVEQRCDSFLQYLVESTKATKYFGVFSDKKSFRNDLYLVAPYKGSRPPKPEFVQEWEGIIKSYFTEKYGFVTYGNLEADDLVSVMKEKYSESIICSPDKDLKQIAGTIFDYKKNELVEVSEAEAMRNLYTQLLTGDTSDNVKGVPGLGPAKVTKLFEGLYDEIEFATVVKDQYVKYYGEYYGEIIESQTFNTIKMLDSTHPMYKLHENKFNLLHTEIHDAPVYENPLDESLLQELGW